LLVALVSGTGAVWPGPAFSQAAPEALQLSDAEREVFLREAEVIKVRAAPGGVTGSIRATLRKGDFVHDAHIQTVDQHKAQISLGSGMEIDFHDSWRNNVAAYRVDRLLSLGMVPVTVERRYETVPAAFTWWVDDVQMTEKQRLERKATAPVTEEWNRQMLVVRAFDQLIYNFDRNLGNLLVDADWRIWMIDHTRAFKIFKDLKNEKNLADRCEKDLLVALRTLDKAALKQSLEGLLSEGQIDALLARRDRIVRCYEAKIASRGEERVLYDLAPRLTVAAVR
jgi:hypothetical protein